MRLKLYVHRSPDGYFMAWTPTAATWDQWSDYEPSEEDCQNSVLDRFTALLGSQPEIEFERRQLPHVIIL